MLWDQTELPLACQNSAEGPRDLLRTACGILMFAFLCIAIDYSEEMNPKHVCVLMYRIPIYWYLY